MMAAASNLAFPYGLFRTLRHLSGILVLVVLTLVSMPSMARAQVPATLTTFDLSGIVLGPSADIPVEESAGPGEVTEFYFDFEINTSGLVWGSDLLIEIIAPDDETWTFFGDEDFGFETFGSFSFTGSVEIAPREAEGIWTVRLLNLWDGEGEITFEAGSRIELRGTSGVIPADPLALVLSESAVSLVRGEAMVPVTASATGGDGDYGFTVDPALPAGLDLDAATGTISGVPEAIQAATVHTVTVTDGTGATATASLEVTVAQPALALVLSESAVSLVRGEAMVPVTASATGGDGDYGFTVAPALPAGLDLDAATGVISGVPEAAQVATVHTVTVTDGTGATASAMLGISVVEVDVRVVEAFQDATGAFLSRRAERILSAEPRGWQLDARRRAQGLSDLAMRANDDGMVLRFATAHVSADTLWHVWAEGEYSRHIDRTGTIGARNGDFGMISVGGDRLLNPQLAMGFMAQFDRAGETIDSTSDISGQGWLAGPYLSAELTPGLFLSARGAWGRSFNDAALDVNQDGSAWFGGTFRTSRTLVRAMLHGEHSMSNGVHFRPELVLAWIRDRQRDYSVSDGISTVAVDGITVERLRVSLAAAIEAPIASSDGRILVFSRPGVVFDSATTGDIRKDTTHGSLEIGLRSGPRAGWNSAASIRYDGIGQSGFEAVSFRMMLSRRF